MRLTQILSGHQAKLRLPTYIVPFLHLPAGQHVAKPDQPAIQGSCKCCAVHYCQGPRLFGRPNNLFAYQYFLLDMTVAGIVLAAILTFVMLFCRQLHEADVAPLRDLGSNATQHWWRSVNCKDVT